MWQLHCGIILTWHKLSTLVLIGSIPARFGKWIYPSFNLHCWLVNTTMLRPLVLCLYLGSLGRAFSLSFTLQSLKNPFQFLKSIFIIC